MASKRRHLSCVLSILRSNFCLMALSYRHSGFMLFRHNCQSPGLKKAIGNLLAPAMMGGFALPTFPPRANLKPDFLISIDRRPHPKPVVTSSAETVMVLAGKSEKITKK